MSLSEKDLPSNKSQLINEASELTRVLQEFKSSDAFEQAITKIAETLHNCSGIPFKEMKLNCRIWEGDPTRLICWAECKT